MCRLVGIRCGVIMSFDSFRTTVTLVHAMTHVDYCNSIHAGLPNFRLYRFQPVLNSTAKVVPTKPENSPESEHMRDIRHWFPVAERTVFMTITLALNLLGRLGHTPCKKLCVSAGWLGRRSLRLAAQMKVCRSDAVALSTIAHCAFTVLLEQSATTLTYCCL